MFEDEEDEPAYLETSADTVDDEDELFAATRDYVSFEVIVDDDEDEDEDPERYK